jgi:hypothetical protein
VNKLDLLFDAKQFAVALGAAIDESNSVVHTCGPDATMHSEGQASFVGAGLSRDSGQRAVHNCISVIAVHRGRSRSTMR